MTYIDTNLLIRIITNDQPALAEQALEIISKYKYREIIVSDAVISELTFVLENSPLYTLPRQTVYKVLTETLMALPALEIDSLSRQAIGLLAKHPRLDYVDCLLLAEAQNGHTVLTFDKGLQKLLAAVA